MLRRVRRKKKKKITGRQNEEREWPKKGGGVREQRCWHCYRELLWRKWDREKGKVGLKFTLTLSVQSVLVFQLMLRPCHVIKTINTSSRVGNNIYVNLLVQGFPQEIVERGGVPPGHPCTPPPLIRFLSGRRPKQQLLLLFYMFLYCCIYYIYLYYIS